MKIEEFNKIVTDLTTLDRMKEFSEDTLLLEMLVNAVNTRSYNLLRKILLKIHESLISCSSYTPLYVYANDVLVDKAKEYATGEDRLHNFRMAEILFNKDPEEFAHNLMLKHIICIVDMIEGRLEYDNYFGNREMF